MGLGGRGLRFEFRVSRPETEAAPGSMGMVGPTVDDMGVSEK